MSRDSGIAKGYTAAYPVALTIIAFLSIATYNVVELTLKIFTTFQRRDGFYFYSLVVASWGILPYALGFFLKFYNITTSGPLYITLIAVGWPCMVTGQSLVLYSRLHLIARSKIATGPWIIILICTNVVACHIPVIVLLAGSNSSNPGPYLEPYSIYEKIQITIFFFQEVFISGVYVMETTKLLRSDRRIQGRNARAVMRHLVLINVVIIMLDASLLGIEYAGYYDIQTTYKAAVYSIKLKMEFGILNQLLDIFQGRLYETASYPTSRSLRTARRSVSKAALKGRRDDEPLGNAGLSLGHTAHATTDDSGEAANGISLRDIKVISTTEVTIEESGSREEHELSGIEIASSSSKGKGKVEEDLPRSSATSYSELHIVRTSY